MFVPYVNGATTSTTTTVCYYVQKSNAVPHQWIKAPKCIIVFNLSFTCVSHTVLRVPGDNEASMSSQMKRINAPWLVGMRRKLSLLSHMARQSPSAKPGGIISYFSM